ncbi:MAG: hypothetical protein CMJ64_22775 [Planctomycetaceae bacterium]|nr:hypothetical protein [Planctomycetaceae bacterium]
MDVQATQTDEGVHPTFVAALPRSEFGLATSTQLDIRVEPPTNEQEILRCVQFALRTAFPERMQQECRRERRYPFPYPVQLQPVNAANEASGEPLVVLGKHITHHGLDFYYQQPIPYRRVIARFESSPDQHVEILMTLTWCRFSRHGWYENGGRFLSAVMRDGGSVVPVDTAFVAEIEMAPETNSLLLGQ